MSWFKVDDKLHGSTKRLIASTAAMGLWVCAGSWSRDKKTGGYIPREALRVIAPDLSYDEAIALAEELVAARIDGLHEHGLWSPMANGWQFHDWEAMQPEDELEVQRRESISQVRREAGLRGAQARWQQAGLPLATHGLADGKDQTPRARPRVGSPSPSGSDPVCQNHVSDLDPNLSVPSLPKDLTGSAREGGDSSEAAQAPAGDVGGSGQGTGLPESEAAARAAKRASKTVFRDEREETVFRHWATVLWPKVHGRREPRATPKRLTHIRARLRDGYTTEQLCSVIDAVARSKWMLGENDRDRPYIEPESFFRSGEKVDTWLAKRGHKSGHRQPSTGAVSAEEYLR